MRICLLLPILMLLICQSQNAQIINEDSSITVLGSKWSKFRQKMQSPNDQTPLPVQSALTSADKNFQRTRRVNDMPNAPDPNADTTDGRAAALEKVNASARSPKSVSVDGFMYQTKIRNTNTKTIEILFWEYQFKERANPANVVSRQFLCGINIKPNKEKELMGFSTHSPGNLISVENLDNKSGDLFEEKISINRVEYSDGTIWQRKDWSYKDMKAAINHALETPWGAEMCRSL